MVVPGDSWNGRRAGRGGDDVARCGTSEPTRFSVDTNLADSEISRADDAGEGALLPGE